MLIVMDSAASAEDVRRVVETVESLGLAAHPIPGAQRTAIGITGNRGSVEAGAFENLPGVAEVIPVSAPYKLVSREAKRENTIVSRPHDLDAGGVKTRRIKSWNRASERSGSSRGLTLSRIREPSCS